MTAQELKETGQRLFKSGQFAEAIPLLKSAADALPKDEPLWQELVMAARDSGQHEQAVEFAKLGIRHHARSDWLWRTLGSELVEVDKLDEAEKALNNSRDLNSAAPWLWRHFIKLHQRRKSYAKEIEAWENLRDLDELSGLDLNCLASPTTITGTTRRRWNSIANLRQSQMTRLRFSTWGWFSTFQKFHRTLTLPMPTAALWR
jgi:tetratricopeptide (TPR) repeat protein